MASYVAGVSVLGALSLHAVQSVATSLARHSLEIATRVQSTAEPQAIALEVSHRVLQEDWFRRFSSQRRPNTFNASPPPRIDGSQRSNLTRSPDAPPFTLFGGWGDRDRSDWDDPLLAPRPLYRTFRTVCVRLCDGFYFPISFAATPDRFGRDEAQCVSSCGSEARLYVYRNPGEDPDQMVDLRGQPYARLKTAFLYRTSYNESCKCRPHAWEQVSLDRHRLYALEAKRSKGDRSAQAEIDQIRERNRQAVLDQRAANRKQSQTERGRNARRVIAETTSGGSTSTDVSASMAATAAPAPEPAAAPLPRGGQLRPDSASTAAGVSAPDSVGDPLLAPPKASSKKKARKAAAESRAPSRSSSGGNASWRNAFER